MASFRDHPGAKARKAPVERPYAQIEAFNVAGANLVHVRLASNRFQFDAGAFGLDVAVVWVDCLKWLSLTAVNILHHGEVKTAKQMSADCIGIS